MSEYKRMGYSPLELMFRAPKNGLVEMVGKVGSINVIDHCFEIYKDHKMYGFRVDVENVNAVYRLLRGLMLADEEVLVQGKLKYGDGHTLDAHRFVPINDLGRMSIPDEYGAVSLAQGGELSLKQN